MKSGTSLIIKLRKLLQGTTNSTLIIWSLGLAFTLTLILYYCNNKSKNKKRNNQSKNQQHTKQHTNLSSTTSSGSGYNVNSNINSDLLLNKCFKWLYFSNDVTNRINDLLVASLNNFYKSSPKLNDFGNEHEITFTDVESLPPILQNIEADINNTKDNLKFKANVELSQIEIRVSIKNRENSERDRNANLKIVSLTGQLTIIFSQNTISNLCDIECSFDSTSEIKLNLVQDQNENELDGYFLKKIEEIVLTATREMNFKLDVNLANQIGRQHNLSSTASATTYFNKNPQHSPLPSPKLLTDDVFDNGIHNYDNNEKRLLVKLLKATNLLNCEEPYCVIEVDQPIQKHITNIFKENLSSIEEQFLFDIAHNSEEITFSLFDRSRDYGNDLVGEAVVLVSDLLNTSCKRVIQLHNFGQTKTGSLTVEFIFIDSNNNNSSSTNIRQNSNKSNLSLQQRQHVLDTDRIPATISDETITAFKIHQENTFPITSNIITNPLYDSGNHYTKLNENLNDYSSTLNDHSNDIRVVTAPQVISRTNQLSINKSNNRNTRSELLGSHTDIGNGSYTSESVSALKQHKTNSLSRSFRNLFHLSSSDNHKNKRNKRDKSTDSSINTNSSIGATNQIETNLKTTKSISGSLRKLFSKRPSTKGRIVSASLMDNKLNTNSLSTETPNVNRQIVQVTRLSDPTQPNKEPLVIRKGFRLP